MRSWILFTFLAIGCAKTVEPVVIDGHQYILIKPGKHNSDGTSDVPLYQRIGDTNRWYTPSLTGRNMVSIMK